MSKPHKGSGLLVQFLKNKIIIVIRRCIAFQFANIQTNNMSKPAARVFLAGNETTIFFTKPEFFTEALLPGSFNNVIISLLQQIDEVYIFGLCIFIQKLLEFRLGCRMVNVDIARPPTPPGKVYPAI